jgi:hypothetical protein
MIKRIAIAIGSIAAAGVLALGLAAAGFGPATTNADQVDAQALADTGVVTDTLIADPAVTVQTETVYIRPAATPKVIHVTKKVPAKASSQKAGKDGGKASSKRSWDEDEDEHDDDDDERDHDEDEEHEGHEDEDD